MNIWFRAGMLLAITSFSSLALATNPALQLVGSLSRFSSDIQLAFYEPDNVESLQQAEASWEDFQQRYQAWIPRVDETQRPAAEAAWNEITKSVIGDGQYEGLFGTGYDASLSGSLTIATDNLRALLLRQPELSDQSLTALEVLWVQSYRNLAGYMLVAAAPFGSFALSADDGEINHTTRVAETDAAWERALREATAAQKPALLRAHRRWQFIRETLLQATQRSLPYIVNVQMGGILRDLESLM